MTDEFLNSMRALREDLRQRLLRAPEYRALVALDRTIEEIYAILNDPFPASVSPAIATSAAMPEAANEPSAQPAPAPLPVESELSASARHSAIAAAFAETLAAKLDHRNGARANISPQPAHRVQVG
jgi:hypothetical protein